MQVTNFLFFYKQIIEIPWCSLMAGRRFQNGHFRFEKFKRPRKTNSHQKNFILSNKCFYLVVYI